MTRILASVRSLAEAQLLSECDIDILDLKEPGAGALGAVAPALAEAVVAQVDRRCRISAAAGVFGDSDLLSFVSALGNSGVDFVKIGFETPVPQEYLAALRAALPATVGAVAVLLSTAPKFCPSSGSRPCTVQGSREPCWIQPGKVAAPWPTISRRLPPRTGLTQPTKPDCSAGLQDG